MDRPVEHSASSRTVVAKGMIFVGVATLLGNGTAYLLSMVSARILDPADFGALGALLGLLVIIATLGISTQALTARRVSTASATERKDVEGQAIRLSIFTAFAILIGAVIISWPVSVIFAIPILAVLTGVASLGFVVLVLLPWALPKGARNTSSCPLRLLPTPHAGLLAELLVWWFSRVLPEWASES